MRSLRKDERFAVDAEVSLGMTSEHSGQVVLRGRCVDISKGGMRVVVPRAVPTRSFVSFRSKQLGIRGSGWVRHCERKAAGYEIGVHFSAGSNLWQNVQRRLSA